MASSKQYVSHLDVFGGMNSGRPPHALAANEQVLVRDLVYRNTGMVQTPLVQKWFQFTLTGSQNKNLTGLTSFGQAPYYLGMSADRAGLYDPDNTSNNRQVYIYNKTTSLGALTADANGAQCLVTGFEALPTSVSTVEISWAAASATYNIKINGTNAGGPYTPLTTGVAGTGAAAGLTVYHKDVSSDGTNTRSWLYTRSLDINHPAGGTASGYKWKYVISGQYLYAINNNYLIKAKNSTFDALIFNTAGYSSVSGRYLNLFYNHLVVAQFSMPGESDAPSTNRLRIGWSHLNNLDDFQPTLTNEADDYVLPTFQEYQGSVVGNSCTGLEKLQSKNIIYTPTGIYEMNYKGLPEVMVIVERSSRGCLFHDAVVNLGYEAHIFPGTDNFYAYDGSGFTPVGDKIKDFFFENVNLTFDGDENSMYGFYDNRTNEAVWRFAAVDSTFKEIRYNLRQQAWTTRNLPSIYTTYDDFFTSTGRRAELGHLLYGTADGYVAKDLEDDETVDDALVIGEPAPLIESMDMVHGPVEKFRGVDTIYLDSEWAECAGIQVELAKRDHLTEAISYTTQSQVWTPDVVEKVLSLPHDTSRIYRYRFTWLPDADTGYVRGVRFLGWAENIYGPGTQAEA